MTWSYWCRYDSNYNFKDHADRVLFHNGERYFIHVEGYRFSKTKRTAYYVIHQRNFAEGPAPTLTLFGEGCTFEQAKKNAIARIKRMK